MDTKEFDAIHKYNIETLELFKSALWAAWVKDGKPQKEAGPIGKHCWVVISGCIERCTKAIKEENEIYLNNMRKRLLK